MHSNARWLCELDGSKPAVGAERSVTDMRIDREDRRKRTGMKFLKGHGPGLGMSNVDAAIKGSLQPHGNSHANVYHHIT